MNQAGTHRKESYWRLVWGQFRKNRLAMAALGVLALLAVVAVAAPVLANDVPLYMIKSGRSYWFPNLITYPSLTAENFYRSASRWEPGADEYALRTPIPFSPINQTLPDKKRPPGAKHWLGADGTGRSVAARLIWGTRISLTIGFVSAGIAVVIGMVVGALAGYYGRWVDTVALRVIEVVICFPSFFLILALMAFLPPSIYNVMVVIGLTGWTGIARLVRGEFLKLRESEFALAARATGMGDARIIFRHLLPNALAPVLVSATFGVAGAILTESALSFLGFGVPAPTASWGELLYQSQRLVSSGVWWLVVFPGAAIFITVTCFNLVGEGLRDAIDPRLRQ
ncbi:MAG: ABC transporter permease [Candidatus Hydrogenedentes bacterium]|nr:ABC transporter permease [Candidatus Hydrogenedentota bacterium]